MYFNTPQRIGRTSLALLAFALISLLPVLSFAQADQGRIVVFEDRLTALRP